MIDALTWKVGRNLPGKALETMLDELTGLLSV